MAGKAVAKVEPEVIEGEVIEGPTLNLDEDGEAVTVSKTQATKEHKALVAAVKAANEYEEQGEDVYLKFFDALEATFHDNVHTHVLDADGNPYQTWTAYVNDHVRLSIPNAEIRKRAVACLSETGVSQRAIAKALVTSQASVSRDQEKIDQEASDSGESVDEDRKVTGLDGREIKKRGKGKAKDTEPEDDSEDAEVIDIPSVNPKAQLPPQFRVAVQQLSAVADKIEALTEDSRFKRASKKLAEEHSEAILAAANTVLDLCDKLGIEVYEAEDEDTEAEADEDTEAEDEAEEFEEDEDETDSETDEFDEDEDESDEDEDESDEDEDEDF